MKLTTEQMGSIVSKSMAEMNSDYRFGQAVFNNLPSVIADQIRATEHDFFYWKNTRKQDIINICYTVLSE